MPVMCALYELMFTSLLVMMAFVMASQLVAPTLCDLKVLTCG